MLNIVFMGTPDFAKESLEEIYNAKYNIQAVVTNPDRPKGRGMKLIASPVKEFAMEKNIKIFQPDRINDIKEELINLKPDLFCVVAYGKILPKDILDIPNLGSINVHGSLLPKYRGAAPIQWAVINGDKKTGITTMYMDEGMDTGDIILQEELEIGDDETTGVLWARLSKLGAKLLVQTIEKIESGIAPRKKQGEDFSKAPMLDKELAQINWKNQTAVEIKNLVRGLNPIMGAYTFYKDKKIKIWKVDTINLSDFCNQFKKEKDIEKVKSGTVIYSDIKNGIYVKSKENIVIIKEIQAENSKKMSINDFLRGNNICEGEILGEK